ncbi:STOREKEEPER protein [Capsicum annuum]|uniref:STOREKEEPER protein n=1 Tax=Capsicum annuum TaxID=4072 RepID=UPI001FB0851D|nr:STOREKEEPER protein [Capsicum annuum]
MAPKAKSRLVDQPPSASSSEEEQVEESQEEEEQEEQSEEGQEEESGEETEEDEPPKKPITQKSLQTQPKPVHSSSESGTENRSGSESQTDSGHSGQSLPSPSASDFTVKPSVPVKAAVPSKEPAKRPPPQEQAQKESKDSRKKKPKIAEEEEKKASATPRSLWSEDDQVAILKGMVEYKQEKGTEPNADMSAFYEFIRGKLQADVSKSQLSDKIRRLKKKFMTSVKDGEQPGFSKTQDWLVYEYSNQIWGAPSNNIVKENVSSSANGKAKKAAADAVKKIAEPKKSSKVSTLNKAKDNEKREDEEKEKKVAAIEVVKEDIVNDDKQDFQSKYPRLAASFESLGGMSMIYPNGTSWLKEKMSSIASDKAKVLEEKWKKLDDAEAALILKRLDLIREHCGLVVDGTRAPFVVGGREVALLRLLLQPAGFGYLLLHV